MDWTNDNDMMDNTGRVITIDPYSIELTSLACPTIFDMRDTKGTSYYFRLRHGHWRFANDDTTKILASGAAPNGLDGVCDWNEALDMIRSAGITIMED